MRSTAPGASARETGEGSAAIFMLGLTAATVYAIASFVETLLKWRRLSSDARRGGLLPVGILLLLLVALELVGSL